MSAVEMKSGSAQVTTEQLKAVVGKAGLELTEPLLDGFSALLTSLDAAVASLPDDGPVQPRPDLQKYPRSDIHIPEDTEFGAWATKVCRPQFLPCHFVH